ncbi:MAG: hypothetical protein RBS36_12815 [Thiomicrospira sp.]|jgi:hypothetical protein|nr:hypothetical protein [Thiomicrospira sp.]
MTIRTHKPAFFDQLTDTSSDNKKGEIRLLVVLDWLYRWRYASQQILVDLLTVTDTKGEAASIRAALRRWDNKFIRSFTLATDISRVGYVLKADGIFKLSMAQPNRAFTKPFTETSSLTTSAAKRHDLTVQAAVIHMLRHGYLKYASEWEYRDGTAGKIFDAVIENADKYRIGIEVEMTPKNAGILRDAIAAADYAVRQKAVDSVLYMVPTPALERTIKRAIADVNAVNVAVKVSEKVAKMAGVRQ